MTISALQHTASGAPFLRIPHENFAGLAQAAEASERFERHVIMNTWLPHDDYGCSPAIQNETED